MGRRGRKNVVLLAPQVNSKFIKNPEQRPGIFFVKKKAHGRADATRGVACGGAYVSRGRQKSNGRMEQ